MSTKPLLHGGSLVLVLLVALGLISFGALAMLSAWSDLQLARTAAEQTVTYYELESLASKRIAELGADKAGTFTVTYNGQNLTVTVLPGHEVTEWRLWRSVFDYETEGVNIWQGE